MFHSNFPFSFLGKSYWLFSPQTIKFNLKDFKFNHWKCPLDTEICILNPKLMY